MTRRPDLVSDPEAEAILEEMDVAIAAAVERALTRLADLDRRSSSPAGPLSEAPGVPGV
jgi:hypothetical protein